jgi:plastocyanin
MAGLLACEAPPELQPDQELRDSLGLTSRDRVHRVRLALQGGREVAGPATVEVLPGDRVSFESADGFVRRVHLERDSLSEAQRAWALDRGVDASPPLVARGSRWLVHFQDAPEGRYPFRVEGGREGGTGAVVVGAARRFPFYNQSGPPSSAP